MKHAWKQPLLWLVGLLFIPAANAASGLASTFQPVIEMFGAGGLATIYAGAEPFWDSVFALIIFIGIAQFAFKDKFGKALPVIIGIILGVGFGVFEFQTGFRLSEFGPIAVLILFGFVVFFLFTLVNNFIQNKLIAFLLALTVVWYFLPQSVVQWLVSKGSIFTWIQALVSIGTVVLIITLFITIFKFAGGGTGFGSSGGSGGGGFGFGGSNGSRINNTTTPWGEKQEEKKKQRRDNAEKAAQSVSQQLQSMLTTEVQKSGEARENVERLGKLTQETHDFVNNLEVAVKPQRDQKMDMAAYQQQQKPSYDALNQRFAAKMELLRAIQANLMLSGEVRQQLNEMAQAEADTKELDTVKFVNQGDTWYKRVGTKIVSGWKVNNKLYQTIAEGVTIAKEIFEVQQITEADNIRGFSNITDIDERLSKAIKEMEERRALLKGRMVTGLGITENDFKEADALFASIIKRTEDLQENIKQAKSLHTTTQGQLNHIKKDYDKFKEDLNNLEKFMNDIIERVTKLSATIPGYKRAVLDYINQPTEAHHKFANKIAEQTLEHISVLEQAIIGRQPLYNALLSKDKENPGLVKTLLDKNENNKNREIINTFRKAIDDALAEEKDISKRDSSLSIIFKALDDAELLSPGFWPGPKNKKNEFYKEAEYEIQRAGRTAYGTKMNEYIQKIIDLPEKEQYNIMEKQKYSSEVRPNLEAAILRIFSALEKRWNEWKKPATTPTTEAIPPSGFSPP